MATKAHLVIDQGTSFENELNLTDENGDPINLIGYSATSMIRKWYTSSNYTAFTCELDTSAGVVILSLSPQQTAALTPGRYVYDVILTETSTGSISRVVEGIVTVTPRSTR